MRGEDISVADTASKRWRNERRSAASARAVAVSCLAHAILALASTITFHGPDAAAPDIAPVDRIDVDFERPVEAPAPVPREAPTLDRPGRSAPALVRHTAARNARGYVRPAVPREIDAIDPVQATVETPVALPTHPALSTAELWTPGVAASLVEADSPRGVLHANRAIFGNRSGPADITTIARAPTDALLAGAANRQPPGTMEHDRSTSRRAAQDLVVLNQVPDLGPRVMRAPLHALGPVEHVESPGEVAAADAAEFGHGDHGFGRIVQGGASACPPPHVLRILFAVDQRVDESVAAIRITQASGIAAVDSAARNALETGLSSASRIDSGRERHSVWAVEIANRLSASTSVCTDGWMVFPHDPVRGVYLMIRVARVRP